MKFMAFDFERINSIAKNYKIRRLFLYLCITLLTFAGGAITAGFWFVSRQNIQPKIKVENVKANETKIQDSETQRVEKAAQDCYQVGVDERRLGIRHYVRPRAQHSDIIGRLAEFVELFGKSRTNTFYISKVESDDDGNPQTNDEYVYAYWKEDNGILILYPPFDVEDETTLGWFYDMRRFDLAKGIVATEEEVGNSHYKLTKQFADELLDKCVKHGIKVTIDKTKFK
jgi:hypothetical protein